MHQQVLCYYKRENIEEEEKEREEERKEEKRRFDKIRWPYMYVYSSVFFLLCFLL